VRKHKVEVLISFELARLKKFRVLGSVCSENIGGMDSPRFFIKSIVKVFVHIGSVVF
jgi:hypothetical protein